MTELTRRIPTESRTNYDELVKTTGNEGYKRDYVLGQKEAIISIQGVLLSEILTASEQRDSNAAYDKKVFMEESGKLDVLHKIRDFTSTLSKEVVGSLLEPETCSEDAIFKALKEEEPSLERLEQIERCLMREDGIVTKWNRGEILINLMRKWNAELDRNGIDYLIGTGYSNKLRIESFDVIVDNNGTRRFGQERSYCS